MSVKGIENANTTKANVTRGTLYTIQKYTLTNTSNTFQINQQARGTDKYENAHLLAVAIEFSRRRERKPSASRTFVRLNALVYKRARQIRRQ